MSGLCPNHGPYDGSVCPYPPPHGDRGEVSRPELSTTSYQPKVFLCHASADKPAVRELYKRLMSDDIEAWLDAENLVPGQNWQVEIPKAIRGSDVVIVCLSENSINKEGFVQKEIKFALDIADEKPEGAIFVIPALLTTCKIPESMSKWHGVNLFEEDGYRRLLNSLRLNKKVLETNFQIENATRPSGFCPEHGPYNGSACPYLHESSDKHTRPRFLDVTEDEEEAPTDLPGSQRHVYSEDEDLDYTPRDLQKNLYLLWVINGRRRGSIHQIPDRMDDGITAGRRDCDLTIDDSRASRIHAKFQLKGGKLHVWDLGSSNGTYVNNKKIRTQTLLEENDLVKIGNTVLAVKTLFPLYRHKITSKKQKTQNNNVKK